MVGKRDKRRFSSKIAENVIRLPTCTQEHIANGKITGKLQGGFAFCRHKAATKRSQASEITLGYIMVVLYMYGPYILHVR